MKKGILLLMLFSCTLVMGQSGFGVKGGLNYGDNGEITFSDVSAAGEDVVKGGDSKAGYHLGVFYQVNLLGFFIRPELAYTQTKSSYDYNDESSNYDISKLDLPVLVGLDVLGPVHVFAGPSLQYILKNDFEDVELEDMENDFTIGAQIGAGVQLGGLGLEVRYERGLKENEINALNLDNPGGLQRVDSRPSQIIFSLLLEL